MLKGKASKKEIEICERIINQGNCREISCTGSWADPSDKGCPLYNGGEYYCREDKVSAANWFLMTHELDDNSTEVIREIVTPEEQKLLFLEEYDNCHYFTDEKIEALIELGEKIQEEVLEDEKDYFLIGMVIKIIDRFFMIPWKQKKVYNRKGSFIDLIEVHPVEKVIKTYEKRRYFNKT